MAKKLYELAVKTSTYTDNTGKQKGRYDKVGVVLEGQDGPYILMSRTFNPAGINSDRDTILISMFQPRDEQGRAPASQSQAPAGRYQAPDDDIPF